MNLTLGYSPCPNDTYIFGALALGHVAAPGLTFDIRLEDVETLNRLALDHALDVTKLSFAALLAPEIEAEYELLASGGALGRGCGPLVVAREPFRPEELASKRIVTPGRRTTAHLLTRLCTGGATVAAELPFEKIMPAVAAGEFDAGVIIHESRFTFPGFGLHKIVDLGEWWETTTGKPIPLGGIVARRSLGEGVIRAVERAIAASLAHADAHPETVGDYIRAHAQEMSEDVQRAHIALYVNEFSHDLGPEGRAAVAELRRRAAAGTMNDER